MKNWLITHFLPMWAKQTVLQDNRELFKQNRQLRQQIKELKAYIRGLELGLRSVKKQNS